MMSNWKPKICAVSAGFVFFYYALVALPSKLDSLVETSDGQRMLRRYEEEMVEQDVRILTTNSSTNAHKTVKKHPKTTEPATPSSFPPTQFPVYQCNCTCDLVYESGEPDEDEGYAMFTLDPTVIEALAGDATICVPKGYSMDMMLQSTAICDERCLA